MKYLNKNDIISINTKLINVSYPDNIHQEDRVDSAVGQIKQSVFGKELYEGLFMKAATLCFLLAKGHGFIDGNKRTASVATILFLKINNYNVSKKNDRSFEINILALTTSNVDTNTFSDYLQSICTES